MKKLFRLGEDFHTRSTVLFSWQPTGNFLATAGRSGVVHIWDRHGEHVDEISLNFNSPVISLEWDRNGEALAILQDGSGQIPVWDIKERAVMRLETSLQDPTYMKWSRTGPQLVVGTAKGNVLIYNKQTRKKVPILGKHPRKITCGAWSKDNRLALGSEDSTLTLSNSAGDTLEQTELKLAAKEMSFAIQKTNDTMHIGPETPETHLSINMGGSSLLLYDLNDPDNPLELAFQQRYGQIIVHKWFGDGFMMLGFSEGYLVVISTHITEIGEELFSGRFHAKMLYDIAYSPVMKYAAVAGDGGVKLVDMNEFKDLKTEAVAVDSEAGRVTAVEWSPDGQILTVATNVGTVLAFLARMPIVHGAYQSSVAYLSSLREISVLDIVRRSRPVALPVAIEPTFIAMGVTHVAVGMNSRVYYYRIDTAGGESTVVNEQEYEGRIDSICLNATFTAVMSGDRITLHLIEPAPAGSEGTQRRNFPEGDDHDGGGGGASSDKASAVAITDNFLIYGTSAGTVQMFNLSAQPGEWAMLSGAELRHGAAIKAIYPNTLGTRVVVVDSSNNGFLYNPVSAELSTIPAFPPSLRHVMWDSHRDARCIFIASDGTELHTYVHLPCTIKGPSVCAVGPVAVSATGDVTMHAKPTPLEPGLTPVTVYDGMITCQVASGSITSVSVPAFDYREQGATPELCFTQALALMRLQDAWHAAIKLGQRAYWLALAGKAMEVMEIDLAVRVYRQLGDAGMVMALERVAEIEDKNLLAGHVQLLFNNHGQAQDLFLSSTRPVTALEMRRDLMHWDQALKLAHTLAPSQVPEISVEYAQQLEFKGEYEAAQNMFESALEARDANGAHLCSDAQQSTCMAGIARCTLRLGNLQRGVAYVRDANDRQLCRECAAILEAMKQHAEAAKLYEMGDQHEKAAAIHIKNRDLSKAASIMHKVTLPKLHAMFAKACEAASKFQEAADAYESARDMDAVVRLSLDQLNAPERAFSIVRTSASSTGAQLVARFCQSHGDFHGAIEFLLMAKRSEEAFELAKTHDQMEMYTKVLGDTIGPDDAKAVAQYYEAQHDLGKAGHFYSLCGQYSFALKLFIQCGEKEVHRAIEVVGKARNDKLTHHLIDFLMGETDGIPKDPHYIYRLYLALGNFPQAGKTAIIIARQEQELGNYKQAHSILFETIQQLEAQGVRVPQSLRHAFVLLHSYMLVKKLVKRGDHAGAARMLLRVSRNISKFPSHVVPILTSTVIECQRAGLKSSAYDYALVLMRPEHRTNIEPKFKRKIEAMIRRPNREEEEEPAANDPISGQPIPAYQLESPATKDAIPMCVVSGRHMLLDDWTVCPNSGMPALHSQYRAYLVAEAKEAESVAEATTKLAAEADSKAKAAMKKAVTKVVMALDPVCGKPISPDDLKISSKEEALAFIKNYNMQDPTEEAGSPSKPKDENAPPREGF